MSFRCDQAIVQLATQVHQVHPRFSSEGQILDPIYKISRNASFGQDLQFLDESANRQGKLRGVNDAIKMNTISLPFRGFAQQVLILGE